jgi:hypothetical protein
MKLPDLFVWARRQANYWSNPFYFISFKVSMYLRQKFSSFDIPLNEKSSSQKKTTQTEPNTLNKYQKFVNEKYHDLVNSSNNLSSRAQTQ